MFPTFAACTANNCAICCNLRSHGPGVQEYPANKRGQYFNEVNYGGVVKAKLLGNYQRNGQRINLESLWTEFLLGPLVQEGMSSICVCA